ncbi:MAG: hypothetical protein LQ338_000422 [Usnochroma carphineum]|nr:MAG: hypothetical protein LQ338_000422 [Usnochroma carphineum]
MSTTGGRRGPTTRSAGRAASSRAASEDPSVANEGPANLRSSRAGSARARSKLGAKDTKTYGSRIVAAGAERVAAAAVEGRAVGGIEAALNQVQEQPEEAIGQPEEETLAPVQEEASQHSSELYGITTRERVQIIEQVSGQDRSRIDRLEGEARGLNGNQPLEGSSVLRKQITLSSSDTSIDRTLSSFLQLKHYLALAAFLMVLVLVFADIYRGPLLGNRFDLFNSRLAPIDTSSIEDRLKGLETKLQYYQPKESNIRDILLRQVNFFSEYNKAEIDWPLTSPTRIRDPECHHWLIPPLSWWSQYLWMPECADSLSGVEADSVLSRPWHDASGPAWCAPHGEGKLQLGVKVQVLVTPTELVVEHMPRSAELDKDTAPAPKEIELWMEVLDDTVREFIGREAEAVYGEFEYYEHSTRNSLTDEYVPIGRWTYDHHSPDYIQPFPIEIDLRGAHSTRLVVRVNSNWGQTPYTCLFRLRLHGISKAPDMELINT